MSINNNMSDFMHYISLHRDFKLAVIDLLECAELNQDYMEMNTIDDISKVRDVLYQIQYMEEHDHESYH